MPPALGRPPCSADRTSPPSAARPASPDPSQERVGESSDGPRALTRLSRSADASGRELRSWLSGLLVPPPPSGRRRGRRGAGGPFACRGECCRGSVAAGASPPAAAAFLREGIHRLRTDNAPGGRGRGPGIQGCDPKGQGRSRAGGRPPSSGTDPRRRGAAGRGWPRG